MKTSAGDFFSADFGGGLAEGAAPPANRVQTAARLDDSALRLIGNSPAMQKVRDLIGRVAPTDSTVLICGESGCGKELVAESVHAKSPRASKPFVAINCAAIPATLIEAELFGHERGSFTGAMRTREGVFERASGGTLLLDEITEMPLDLQSRLLRVLETKRLNRVGGSSDLEVDVRVVASTNRSPAQAFEEGRLREDIYYRLAVVTVQLPPLRERGDDVLVLAEFFLAELNLRNGTHKRVSACAGVPSQTRANVPGLTATLTGRSRRSFRSGEGAVRRRPRRIRMTRPCNWRISPRARARRQRWCRESRGTGARCRRS